MISTPLRMENPVRRPIVPPIRPGVLLRIRLKQGKEKRLLARILEILEKARKRLSRQNSTKKVRKCEGKRPEQSCCRDKTA